MIFFEKIKSKFIDYFDIIKDKMSRSEVYTIILPTVLACLFLLIFVPFLFNNSALQFQIEQRVSAALKANLEIDGNVDVALLPTLSITVNDVVLQNYVLNGTNHNFYAKKVKIKLSFLSSLMGNFAIDKIIFSDAILQSYNNERKPAKTSDAITEIIAKKAEALTTKKEVKGGLSGKMFVDLFKIDDFNLDNYNITNFPKILIEKSSWITYDKFSNKREILSINAETNFSKKKIISEGSFLNQNILNNFDLKAHFESTSDKDDSTLNLSSSFGNFKISGIFPDKNLGFLNSIFKGTIEAEIFDLKNFYKSYVARDGFIYSKINPIIKPIKLKATIINDNKQININNIFVNSNIINGRGNIAVDLSSTLPLIDVTLKLENIDLDSVWLTDAQIIMNDKAQEAQNSEDVATENKAEEAEVENKEDPAPEKEDGDKNALSLNLAKDLRDFDLTAEISVSRVKYLDDEIKNVSLYTSISKQGEILILPLTLEVPGGGLFRMSGVLENHEIPKFIGSLDASGTKLSSILKWLHLESQNLIYENLKEYNLYADIMLVPNLTTLNNIYLNINNGKSELLGESRIHYTSKTSSILSNFRINHLVVDDYFLTSGQNIYLSPGSLLKKILWLNNLSSNNDLSLAFDTLQYKDHVFDNQSMKIRFGQGYFEVRELKLNSDKINLSASFNLDISGRNPKFDIFVKSKNLVYNSTNNKINEGRPNLEQNDKITALDQFYALPSLEGFNGEISFNLENADFDNFNAKNVLIAGKLKDGIIEFSDFSADIYEGSLIYRGVMGIKFDKAISGNATLSAVALKPILFDIADINNIDATANISASIESISSSSRDFFKNLTSSIKFSTVGVNVRGYGLNDLIKKMFNVANYKEDLLDPEKILLNPDAITNFKQATGTFTVAKGRDNLFRADVKTVAANGIISGKIDLIRKSIDASTNIVFLTGTLKKQIPLNIASNLRGEFGNIRQSTNLDQVKQYLGLPYTPTTPTEAETETAVEKSAQIEDVVTPSNEQSNTKDDEVSKTMQNLNDQMEAYKSYGETQQQSNNNPQ